MKLSKFRSLLILAPILVSILFFCSNTPNQEIKKEDVLAKAMVDALKTFHFAPQNINDSLSAKVFDEYLKRVDYGKRFITQKDLDTLNKYKYQIDNEIKNSNIQFFEVSVKFITKRIKEVEEYYEEILDEPFDFDKKEDYETDPGKREYAANMTELKDRWRKTLKYETLRDVVNKLETQEQAKEDKDTSVTIKTFEQLEKEAREDLKEKYDDLFHRFHQYEKSDRRADFMNAIANIFDPHTGFFPPKDKEDFDIKMSGKLEGIGALLSQRDEYIRVEDIVAGGPAWKQGDLKKGDIILKVAQEGEDPVDVVDMRLDKAVQLIRGKKGTEVVLTVKKPDGTITEISIIRDVVYREEAFAKSVILKNEVDRRVGYIRLPSFYADFKDNQSRRSSDDVLQEVEKLKKKGMDGLILDLRDNGGGSLVDAVKIAGLFIDKGPIVQVYSSNGMLKIRADRDGKVYYEDPLVILVNSFSASASEIVSAAMQDYNRAIVMGSASTYGKGTVQRFIDLDRAVSSDLDRMKPLGALKLTIQKFYRINGGSTQLKGVTPDIIMPDKYKYIDLGEKELDYAIEWDKIKQADYSTSMYSLSQDEKNPIVSKSYDRIKKDTTFTLIDKNAQRLKENSDRSTYSLNFDEYKDFKDEQEKISEKFSDIGKDSLNIELIKLEQKEPETRLDSTRQASLEKWHGEIVKDLYLYEAVNVVNDIISAKVSKK